jgi:hypothetical protein
MQSLDIELDRPIFGAIAIARAANLVDRKGRVEIRKAYRALKLGRIPASKFGREWVSTQRRILNAFGGGVE